MSNEYHIRLYEKNDEEKIAKLLDKVFNGWPRFDLPCSLVEHWRWKYTSTIFKNPIAVCLYDDEIVACDHEQLRKVKIGNDLELCSNGCDSAVHPDHRRKGLYTKTHSIKEEALSQFGIGMSYSVTNNKILIENSKKNNIPTFPNKLKLYMRINDVEKHVFQNESLRNQFIKKQGYKILSKVSTITNKFNNQKLDDYYIEKINQFDDKVDVFLNKISPHYNFIILRDKEYLNWRYCDQRGGEYLVNQIKENNEVLGYNILRINKRNPKNPLGYIIDQVALPHRLDIIEALTQYAVEYFDSMEINDVSVWLVNNHPYEKIYKKIGFIDVRSDPYLTVIPFKNNASMKQFTDSPADKLHFQIGDCDWI